MSYRDLGSHYVIRLLLMPIVKDSKFYSNKGFVNIGINWILRYKSQFKKMYNKGRYAKLNIHIIRDKSLPDIRQKSKTVIGKIISFT